MKLPILNTTYSNNIEEFIECWSVLYNYPNDELYSENIIKKKFIDDDIKNLFKWKNGMTLSDVKGNSLTTKITSSNKIDKINEFKNQITLDEEAFLKEFKNLSAVWKIFLLHIIKPTVYPIYDQHIHRAYCYINNDEEWVSIDNTLKNDEKEKFYFEKYQPFVSSLKYPNLKKMDEAFFAFGQLLKKQSKIIR